MAELHVVAPGAGVSLTLLQGARFTVLEIGVLYPQSRGSLGTQALPCPGETLCRASWG